MSDSECTRCRTKLPRMCDHEGRGHGQVCCACYKRFEEYPNTRDCNTI